MGPSLSQTPVSQLFDVTLNGQLQSGMRCACAADGCIRVYGLDAAKNINRQTMDCKRMLEADVSDMKALARATTYESVGVNRQQSIYDSIPDSVALIGEPRAVQHDFNLDVDLVLMDRGKVAVIK